MKILQLQSENVKRVVAVDIRPGDKAGVVEITGKNGQGKTSVLDSIFWALADAKHLQEEPIRAGADRAVIRLDLGKLIVTRTIRKTKDGEVTTQLRVENEEGARFSKPQEMMDALVAGLSFDPLAFTRKKPKEQFDALRVFVKDFDFDANAGKRKTAFEQRTEKNRDAKGFAAQADGVTPDEAAKDLAAIDVDALVDKLNAAGETNAEIERRRSNRERAKDEIATQTDRATDLRQRAKNLRDEAAELERQAEEISVQVGQTQKKLDEAPALSEPIRTEELVAQISAARATNTRVAQYADDVRRKAELQAKADAADAEAKALTAKIEAIDKEKTAAIAKAKMPVEGLGFGDDIVMFEGFPLNQASGAAQLRISCAIASALNPKLRVLRVTDGALLDDDSMKLLQTFAVEHDMQIWIETVTSGRPGAVVIEAGEVVGADKTEAA